ncbi:stage 0 sporulation family protein [uncultured Chloroflexus sp.]|uniref:PSP1 domain-containing protein n=1 Tax=uncultured Chloroflexus sp. TaxID=214040 RepID=UPI0026062D75|nr:stage 0 sporulation family protein [uncultured Chloroflexus sp.]
MPIVVGIRFKDSGKIYYFDPRDLELHTGDPVIVETVRGLELARVAFERREVGDDAIVGELKPVVRRAEDADLARMAELQQYHAEALARCAEKVQEHGLPMKLVKAEYSFDGSRLTFYFTADQRVDFRQLVRDLARTFKTRIELRQIGPRDEAKMLGGIGPCGRILCCASFLPDYARVSIKMAKDQDLPLNPSKISGVCGRLLCCLSYEHEQYLEMRSQLPKRGTWVMTPDGPGEVVGQHVLKQQVLVQLASSGMIETYDIPQITLATEQVAALARARAAEGITPARPAKTERGERRMLRDEVDAFEWNDDLSLLEDDEPSFSPPAPVLPPIIESSRDAEQQLVPKSRARRRGGNAADDAPAAPAKSPGKHPPATAAKSPGKHPSAAAAKSSGKHPPATKPSPQEPAGTPGGDTGKRRRRRRNTGK